MAIDLRLGIWIIILFQMLGVDCDQSTREIHNNRKGAGDERLLLVAPVNSTTATVTRSGGETAGVIHY